MKKVFILTIGCNLFFSHVMLSQNIGIGISNPTKARLEVHGAVGATSAIFGAESSGISLQRNWPGIGYNQYYNNSSRYISNGFAAVQFMDPNNGYMAFDMLGNGNANAICNPPKRALTIHQTGRVIFNGPVGINKDNPTHPLEVRMQGNNGMILVGEDNLHNWEFLVTNNPAAHLYVNFDGSFLGYFHSTSGQYASISDSRLKTKIDDLPMVIPNLMQLKPVTYKMFNSNPLEQKTIGFIAQDVKKYFPELVTVLPYSAHGYKGIEDLHTLNYNSFGILAIKAIQEQQQMINELKRITALQQDMNEELIRRIEKLESNLITKNKK